jgi:ssDNA-binding Zn-finger/Zn-ribbon topoisomerase 1
MFPSCVVCAKSLPKLSGSTPTRYFCAQCCDQHEEALKAANIWASIDRWWCNNYGATFWTPSYFPSVEPKWARLVEIFGLDLCPQCGEKHL